MPLESPYLSTPITLENAEYDEEKEMILIQVKEVPANY